MEPAFRAFYIIPVAVLLAEAISVYFPEREHAVRMGIFAAIAGPAVMDGEVSDHAMTDQVFPGEAGNCQGVETADALCYMPRT